MRHLRHLAQQFGLAFLTVLIIVAVQTPGLSQGPRGVSPWPANPALLTQGETTDREAEAERLFQQGRQQFQDNQFREALQTWEAALTLYRAIGNQRRESHVLANLGLAYQALEQYSQAIHYLNEAWQLAQDTDSNPDKIRILANLVDVYWSSGEHQLAIDRTQQLLTLIRESGDRPTELTVIIALADTYSSLGQYPQAIDLLEQALEIAQAIEDHQQQANALNLLGWTHFLQSNYRRAIDFAEQAIALYREISDRSGEARALNHLGSAYVSLDQYEQAIDIYQQSLAIVHELGDQQTEVFVLGNLGETYRNASQYELAIDFYEQSLAIAREINHTSGELNALANLGSTYLSIGQYQQAISLYEQSLALSRQVSARAKEGILLNNLGVVYRNLGEHRRAIGFYEQSLAIAREVGNRQGESNALHNLGGAYQSLGQNERAIDFYEQVLTITREIGDRAGEGNALGNLGLAYSKQGQDERAIDFYEQHLGIAREIGDRPGEGRTLANLGRLLAEKDQSELAIVFLKAAVEVRESIRSDIRGLDTDLRQSFTNTIADDYRFLANLLLGQGRIPEAQQVLDLLKLEELREFTDITRATWTGSKLQYTDPEQDVIDAHSSLIAFGSDVIVCEETNCAELNSLYDRLSTLTAQYNQQVEQFQETIRRNRSEDEIFQDPDSLSGEAEKLLSAYAQDGQQTVLIYPFVLEDKLWIVWAAAGNVIGSVEVPVSQGELATTVQRFGELLNSPNQLAELQVTSQQLYDWIIRPLETELTANNIDHLIFVNDRVTRYIPMAALYDGQQYLLERYTLSTVLAPGLTDTEDRLTNIDESEVLGLGLTQAVADFSPLPAVSEELDAIVRSDDADAAGVYPGQVFLDDDFTLDTLKENVINHRVLHMATHAAFVPGQAEESFIMLGNGDPLKIADIEAMERRLRNLHMVVLSACQTALGGTAGDGNEIAGISSYFLEVGRAETVIASLWVVADTSTSLLMQHFYELLASGELTKAEALRQAQLSLLYDEDTETRLTAARTAIAVAARDGRPLTTTGFNHPYHWAPFILIGNGL